MLQPSHLSLNPTLHTKPSLGTGELDLGFPASYDLEIDNDDFLTELFTYQGNDIVSDISGSSSSSLTTWTFLDAFGKPFATPKGAEYIRIIVDRVDPAIPPEPAAPVSITTVGPGLPALAIDLHDTADMIFYLPRAAYAGTEWTSSSHISLTVASANIGILKATLQLKLWKPA